ncbi:hypothetical protein, partial [Escherichia coli]
GYATAGKNDPRLRAAGPAAPLHYLQNLLEPPRQDAAARQKTPA